MNASQLEEAAVYATEHATEVARNSPDHGPRHWRDVARVAWAIRPEANPLVFLFACLHDTQRLDEYFDPEHGQRAADAMVEMCNLGIIDITSGQMNNLHHALVYHDKGVVHEDDGIEAVCWDADRLLLPRVGIVPDINFFSVDKVRADLQFATDVAMGVAEDADTTWGEIARTYS